jgi:predicted dehydrogenase
MRSTTPRLKIALVGCGDMGLRHLRAYAELAAGTTSLELVGVFDFNTELAQRRSEWFTSVTGRELTVYSDFDQLLSDDEVEAVDLVLPTRAHHEPACAVMRSGRHVMVEKPLALTIKAGQQMIRCAEETKRTLAVGQNYRFFPANRAMAYALHSGAIGTPNFATTRYLMDSGGLASLSITEGTPKLWHHDVLTMGSRAVLGTGVHEMDLLRYWFGEVVEVFGAVRTLEPTIRTPAGETLSVTADDTCMAMLRFESGFLATITISMAAGVGRKIGDRVIGGTEGRIACDSWAAWDAGEITGRDGTSTSAREYVESFFTDPSPTDDKRYLLPEGSFRRDQLTIAMDDPLRYGIGSELEDFARCALEGSRPQVDAVEGLKSSAVSFAVLESSLLGAPVAVADVENGIISAWQQPIDDSLDLDASVASG